MTQHEDNQIQADHTVRIVALSNLRAMCDHVSGVAHRYWVEHVKEHRVRVGYSNPDEYGTDNPMFAEFPAFVDHSFGQATTYVILGHMLRVINDTWNGLGDQAFEPITDCPVLWRSPQTGEWKTRQEVQAHGGQK